MSDLNKLHLIKNQEDTENSDNLLSHLNELLDNMNQGLLYLSKEGIVSSYNAAAEVIMGMEHHLLLDKSIFDSIKDDYFGFSLEKALQGEEIRGQYIVTLHSSFGFDRLVEVCPSPFFHEGTFIGLLILLRDLTEYHRLQQEEVRGDRLKALGELASHVAHEIRNPIGAIKGFASLLEEDLAEELDKLKLLKKVVQGIDDLNLLVNQILDFSRPLEGHFENIDLVPFLKEFETKNVILKTDLKVRYIFADKKLLAQALLNLIKNGIESLPEGANVSLVLENEGTNTLLKVVDNGCGITDEGLSKLFQPLYTTKVGGNGFGLSYVHKIVTLHGATIEVFSKIGEGSCFQLRFYK